MATDELIKTADKLGLGDMKDAGLEELRQNASIFVGNLSPRLAPLGVLVYLCEQKGHRLTMEHIEQRTGHIAERVLRKYVKSVSDLRVEPSEKTLNWVYQEFAYFCGNHLEKDSKLFGLIPLLEEDLRTVLNKDKKTMLDWQDTIEHMQRIVSEKKDKYGNSFSHEELVDFYAKKRKALLGIETIQLPPKGSVNKSTIKVRREVKPRISRRIMEEYLFLPEYLAVAFARCYETTPQQFTTIYEERVRDFMLNRHVGLGEFRPHLFYEILRLFSKDQKLSWTRKELSEKVVPLKGGFYKDEDIGSVMNILNGIGLTRAIIGVYSIDQSFLIKRNS